ncbi:RluA family pseudouridine synthase [Candidatus Absconditicoccus praedator]|uniref:RluA family pseudouridine synthase n=1 Tax=Candidatus Absconditicoccus praedator TaxID=2735562 RepID=UPI001E62BEF0|nr:RluA family pseudouridine synthase [Candidatus Absconditicoccus praedator]UFX83219.1 RluA family pseudouridine synthase [Candidatus Absconditicoccus praedator]
MDNIIYKGEGERIDKFLVGHFGYSRNFFHHIIKRKGICINNKPIKKSYKLKNGDNISIEKLERFITGEVLEDFAYIDLEILKEEYDYLVIKKPKGVISHPGSIWDVSTPSVVGFLYQKYKKLPSIGNFIRAGLIHRLDKETSGPMIIAKTEKGLSHFKKLFKEKSESIGIQQKEEVPLKKFYTAECTTTPNGKSFLDQIELPHYIQEIVYPKVPNIRKPKEGITKILSKQNKGKNIILFIEILTGRTHQIRYHLSSKGLPILGDYLYGKKDDHKLNLECSRLEFLDTNNEYIVVDI